MKLRQVLCALKGHKKGGCYQGYIPDIFCNEVCCACGADLKLWDEIFSEMHTEEQKAFDARWGSVNGRLFQMGDYGRKETK